MKKLTKSQIDDRTDFISNYIHSDNASSGSEVDANANVTQKSLATVEAELYKPYTLQINKAATKTLKILRCF